MSLLPAWRASRVDLVSVVNRRASSFAGAKDERWQAWLLTGQLAAVVVLLSGTSLFATSFVRLVRVQLALIVRAAPGSRDVVNRVKSRIRAVDPALPVVAGVMSERLLESVWRPRFFSRLALAFTLLAAAIGASGAHLIRLVLRRGLVAGGLGLVGGLSVSLKWAGAVEGMLFATRPTDPIAMASAAAALAVLLVAGCLVPADNRRHARFSALWSNRRPWPSRSG